MHWILTLALVFLQQTAAVTLTPDSGPAGTTFRVDGSGFVPGERVKLLWDGANLGGTLLVGSDGSITSQATVPADANPGPHTVGIQSRKSDTIVTTFQVASPVTTTTTAPTTTTVAVVAPTPTTTTATSNTVATSPTTTPSAATPTEPAVVPPAAGTPTTRGASDAVSTTVTEPAIESDEGKPGTNLTLVALVWFVALGGGAALFLRRRRTEPVTSAAQPDTTPVVDTPPPPATVEAHEGRWTRHGFEPTPAGRIAGLIHTPDGWLAVGTTIGDDTPDAVVWRSDDGHTWMPGSVLGAGSAIDVVRREGGLVVVGSAEVDGRRLAGCWVSDDGADWTRTVDSVSGLTDVLFEGAAEHGDVVVAFGRGPTGPGAWMSRSRGSWEPVPTVLGIELVTAMPTGFLAFGRRPDGGSLTVARSDDGRSWEIPADETFTFEGSAVLSAAAFDGGMVAGGLDMMRNTGALWVSDDGERWLRTPFDPGEGHSITHLESLDDRLVAVGVDHGAPGSGRSPSIAVWQSRDAVQWERADGDSAILSGATVSAVAVAGRTMMLAGGLLPRRDSGSGSSTPAIWLGDLTEAPVAADGTPVASSVATA